MGYRFCGFFTEWNPHLGEEACRRWPGCTWRPIYEPFFGIGVRCPGPGPGEEDRYDELLELSDRVEREVPEFIVPFGNPTVVFVEAECFGGKCVYGGWVLRSGSLELHIRITDALESGTHNLKRLLAALGAQMETGHFTPFARGFWGD